ncbi:hypothetical protein SBA4_5160006 [Candidatus Sulfopaludibacter sp. SbA4]|nr:hypothetical protein SBA4_5160006 [Candidatus Sulfopaludibacter sp. SbA4]
MGLRNILSQLSKNRTPTEVATLTLPQAAALRESPGPDPQSPESPAPVLSTSQPTESTTETQQMVSFGKRPEIPALEQPSGFPQNTPNVFPANWSVIFKRSSRRDKWPT